MKRLNLKRILILATLPFVAGSCLKSSDPDFVIRGMGYVLQQNVVNEGTVNSTFAPYIAVSSPYQEFPITDVNVSGGDMFMRKISSYAFESPLRYSDKLPDATYTVTAVTESGETSQLAFTLKPTKKMSNLEVTKLSYSMSRGIRAEWKAVDNAAAYVLMFSVEVTDEYGMKQFYRINNVYANWQEYNNNGLSGLYSGSFSFNYANVNLKEGDRIEVAVAALSQENLIVESTHYIVTIGTDMEFVGEGDN